MVHEYAAVVVVTVWVETSPPSTNSLNVFELPEAPVTDMLTVTVPLTVEPAVGLVMAALMPPTPLETVTGRMAVAVRFAPSTPVTVIV